MAQGKLTWHRGDITGDIYLDFLRPPSSERIPFIRLYMTIDERLIRRHKSPEHTALNIQAAEAPVEYGGYRIVEQAPDIQLSDGDLFIVPECPLKVLRGIN